MSKKIDLLHVCPFKLHETYDSLYELQEKLGISDEYLLSTRRDLNNDEEQSDSLQQLLKASRIARDNLITWHLKQTLVELNVTISLLTARIKFIEYKLSLCDGLDLHQACSLSLVNFCNILTDMTVLNVKPAERKTMHKISSEVGVPVWLSHYRNQICHVPSESPSISVLVPLVAKSLNYMKDSFWSKLIERDSFDAKKCMILIVGISKFTNITSINQQMQLKKDIDLGKRRMKLAQSDIIKSSKACHRLRRLLIHNPDQVIEILLNFLVLHRPNDANTNCGLLIEQVILAHSFERFVIKLLAIAEKKPREKIVLAWLQRIIALISLRKKETIRKALTRMGMNISVKMIRLTDIPAVKCCQIAYRLMRLDHYIVRTLVLKMRHRLLPVLGKKRTLLLIQLTNIAKSRIAEKKRDKKQHESK